MKVARAPHLWRLSPSAAVQTQLRLAARVRVEPLGFVPRFVAGLDCSFSADERWCLAAVVVWDCVEHCVVEVRWARRQLRFPYIPGLLSFREIPVLLAALRKLTAAPEVLMCDGHGLAHPRRFGLACHLGVITGFPTLGCAKSRLVGPDLQPASARGSSLDVILGHTRLGIILRTRDGVRPVYVSPGHRIDFEGARELVLRCTHGKRLPEPTRLADHWVGEVRRGMEPVRQTVCGSRGTASVAG